MPETWITLVTVANAALLVGILLGVLAYICARIWMAASRQWRSIFRAESAICDYLQHRKDFERWKKERENHGDLG